MEWRFTVDVLSCAKKKQKKNALNENSFRENARKKNLFGIPRLIYKAI